MRHFTQILLLATGAVALEVSVLRTAPTNAVKLSNSLLSFSIEQDRWTDWIGSTQRNDFFYNTLDNIKQLTGAPPQVRIGANSEDKTDYNAGVKVCVCFH